MQVIDSVETSRERPFSAQIVDYELKIVQSSSEIAIAFAVYYIVLHATLGTMDTTISIRIDSELDQLLSSAAKRSGRAKSDLVREALRRQLAVESFHHLRNTILPYAEAQGMLTDEDIWREIS